MEGSQRECGLGCLIHREQSRVSAGGTASTGGTDSADGVSCTDSTELHAQHGVARSCTELHGVARTSDYTDYTDYTDPLLDQASRRA